MSTQSGSSRRRRPRRTVEIAEPRLSIWHVLGRVRIRLIDIQVWDVAGTMTFYTLLSVFPAAVAMVSMVSLLGIEETTVEAFTGLVSEIFPHIELGPYVGAILQVAGNGGKLLGLVLGILGALISASNGVAAFHRAMHRVYDTREGRPFLWFRTIVLFETTVAVAVFILALGMVIVGGQASQTIGNFVGIPQIAFDAWNLVKWPILLMILIVTVSLAYYLFPNVRLPRYRIMTLGSIFSVLSLFLLALAVGRLAGYVARFSEILVSLNSVIGLLLLLWLANIVLVAGAALDAEFLRARQVALGLPAWEHIDLEPHATHALDFLASDAEQNEETSRVVAESARTGQSVRIPRSLSIVSSTNLLAVNPSRSLLRSTSPPPPASGTPQEADAPAPASPVPSDDPSLDPRTAPRSPRDKGET